MVATAASRKTRLDAMFGHCKEDDTFVALQPMGIFLFSNRSAMRERVCLSAKDKEMKDQLETRFVAKYLLRRQL